jgi:hypothetical protein
VRIFPVLEIGQVMLRWGKVSLSFHYIRCDWKKNPQWLVEKSDILDGTQVSVDREKKLPITYKKQFEHYEQLLPTSVRCIGLVHDACKCSIPISLFGNLWMSGFFLPTLGGGSTQALLGPGLPAPPPTTPSPEGRVSILNTQDQSFTIPIQKVSKIFRGPVAPDPPTHPPRHPPPTRGLTFR